VQENSLESCKVLALDKIHNRAGNITVVEPVSSIPFEVKRVYYLYDIPGGIERGGHAHKSLHQLIIAVSGSFDVILDDGTTRKSIQLNRPYYGLHVVPGMWRELNNFSSGAICLVLASEHFNEDDYIRDYEAFKMMKHAQNSSHI